MKQRILLIADDDDDFKILHESLIQVGFTGRVHHAASGEEAFKFLDQQKSELPSLIILDLNMFKTDGIEVLIHITSEYGIPVVVYTTACTDEIVTRVKGFGAIDCLQKGTRYSDNLKFSKRIVQWIESANGISSTSV
jgi:CheY-like chemotaxis protein